MKIASIVAPESVPFAAPPSRAKTTSTAGCPWPEAAASESPDLSANILSTDLLTGSWYLLLMARGAPAHQGTLRFTGEDGALAASADLYRTQPGMRAEQYPKSYEVQQATPHAWYPQPNRRDYTHHLRSMGGAVVGNTVSVDARVFSWTRAENPAASNRVGEFDATADTTLTLTLHPTRHTVFDRADPSTILTGSVMVDGSPLEVWAAKTSPVTRGLSLVIHEMDGLSWPDHTQYNTTALQRIFREAGIDLQLVNGTDPIPHDGSLTRGELDAMLAEQVARFDEGSLWIQHLFLVSLMNWSGLDGAGLFGNIAGIMFDNVDRHRQGSALFLDARIASSINELNDRIDPSARNQPLAKVPKALLRTAAHEIGHGLGLRHASTDRAENRGIMNQVQELLRQADPKKGLLFPDNAVLEFDTTARRHLCHRPDPEVCPGWGNWSVPPKGAALGLQPFPDRAQGMRTDRIVDMRVAAKPANELAAGTSQPALKRVFDHGEPVFLELTIENAGSTAITVPTAVTLADSMCEVAILDPGARRRRLVGAAQTMCEGTGVETLHPGAIRRHILQIHSDGEDPVFRLAGDHVVEIAVHVPERGWVQAPSVVVAVRPDMASVRGAFRITGRHPFCDAMALGYISSYRGVADIDRLLRSAVYPLGARLAAGVLQIATFAERPDGERTPRVSPMRANVGRVDRAIDNLRDTGVTKEVLLAVAEAIDPLSDSETLVAAVLNEKW